MTDIVHVDAKVSLHGYNAWRQNLEALPVGTVIEWVVAYNGFTLSDSTKAGQCYRITKVRDPVMGSTKCDADKVYEMVLVSKNGKAFKKTIAWSVEGIARNIHKTNIKISEQT